MLEVTAWHLFVLACLIGALLRAKQSDPPNLKKFWHILARPDFGAAHSPFVWLSANQDWAIERANSEPAQNDRKSVNRGFPELGLARVRVLRADQKKSGLWRRAWSCLYLPSTSTKFIKNYSVANSKELKPFIFKKITYLALIWHASFFTDSI